MSVNRSLRRAAEKKAAKSGTDPVQLLKGLANLDGVSNLSTKLDEFLVASKKMEAIAGKLDEAEIVETLGAVRDVATTLRGQLESTIKKQELHNEILLKLIAYLRDTETITVWDSNLEDWESKLKEAHGGQ
jgi:hypothetical protein